MTDAVPRTLLRLEGAAVFAAAVALYAHEGHSWWLFVALLLAPDLGMVGYVFGTRVGSITYDATHFEALPVALAAAGLVAGSGVSVQLGLIWLAHIGLDRALGYGLKYATRFKDTHLQRV